MTCNMDRRVRRRRNPNPLVVSGLVAIFVNRLRGLLREIRELPSRNFPPDPTRSIHHVLQGDWRHVNWFGDRGTTAHYGSEAVILVTDPNNWWFNNNSAARRRLF